MISAQSYTTLPVFKDVKLARVVATHAEPKVGRRSTLGFLAGIATLAGSAPSFAKYGDGALLFA